jgi:hypothetical protein
MIETPITIKDLNFHLGNARFADLIEQPSEALPEYEALERATLNHLELTPIDTVLFNGKKVRWPSVSQQIQEYRNRHHPNSVPANRLRFALTPDGTVVFVKMALNPPEWGGLAREAQALELLDQHNPQAKAPKLYFYLPPSQDPPLIETLVTSAFLPEDGWMARHVSDYTPDQAKAVAHAMIGLEGLTTTNFQEDEIITVTSQLEKILNAAAQFDQIPDLSEEFIIRAMQSIAQALTYAPEVNPRQISQLVDFLPNLDQPTRIFCAKLIAQAHQMLAEKILVHGDTWLKNILLSQHQAVITDWERAGPGLIGQDQGRTGWDFGWANVELLPHYVKAYISTSDPEEFDQRVIKLRFGLIFEALRWLHDRYAILEKAYQMGEKSWQKKHPDRTWSFVTDQILSIKQVQEKALHMLQVVDQIAAEQRRTFLPPPHL